MLITNYIQARKWIKEYRVIEKEVKSRISYINDYKKILEYDKLECSSALKKVYTPLIIEMESSISKLKRRLKDIDKAISKLDDLERSVIYHRYILGIPWINMPEYVLYEQRSCQLAEVRALKKIAKMNIEWRENNVE